MVSAMLSEMVASGKLKVSFLKIGSSPLYYLSENVQMLENYISHLNEKDRKTVEILKSEGVLQDRSLDPLSRVSLRQIKDFAKPLEVTVNGSSEIFWKWYLLNDEETEKKVRHALSVEDDSEKSLPVQSPVQQLSKQESVVNVLSSVHASNTMKNPVEKKESVVKEQKFTPVLPVQPQTKPSPSFQAQSIYPSVAEKPKVREQKPDAPLDPFLVELLKFFTANNIIMTENSVVKKNSEIDFTLEFDSLFGILSYYCKARKKKKISASDLYSAFVQGQLKKLPVIFLTNGELTKQALEALKNLKGITYKHLPLPQ